jgi:hypothetical protein
MAFGQSLNESIPSSAFTYQVREWCAPGQGIIKAASLI